MRKIGLILGMGVLILTSCEKEPLEDKSVIAEEETTTFEFRKGNGNPDHKLDVCKVNANMVNVDYHAAYTFLEKGAHLFSCNPSEGVDLDDIIDELEAIVIADGGDVNKKNDMKKAFEDWYINSYLTGEWTKDEPSGGSSGGGSAGGGLGGGGL